jgi:hypothetical protein
MIILGGRLPRTGLLESLEAITSPWKGNEEKQWKRNKKRQGFSHAEKQESLIDLFLRVASQI